MVFAFFKFRSANFLDTFRTAPPFPPVDIQGDSMLSLLTTNIQNAYSNPPSQEVPQAFIFFLFLFLIRFYLFISRRSIPAATLSYWSSAESSKREETRASQNTSEADSGL
jgi:hypothetical protein